MRYQGYTLLPLVIMLGLLLLPQAAISMVTGYYDTYNAAFSALDRGQTDSAKRLAAIGPDVILNKVLLGELMARPRNDYTFDELAAFIANNPDWPGIKGIAMIAEQKLPENATRDSVLEWFAKYPPFTGSAFNRYIAALNSAGQAERAATLVRSRWIERDISGDDMAMFLSRYAGFLTRQDHLARLDRLLWEGKASDARALYRFIDDGNRALAEARIVLANPSLARAIKQDNSGDSKNAKNSKNNKGKKSKHKKSPSPALLETPETVVARVPASLRNDSGLLFEQLRNARKNNDDAKALAILRRAPKNDLRRPDLWWDERSIIIRRLMENHNWDTSYTLTAAHGLSTGQDFSQAEFMAGWLALRALNRPADALNHFDVLASVARTPITRARAAYWQGRAYEILGRTRDAQQAFETAAALNLTIYGQIAQTRLSSQTVLNIPAEPEIPSAARTAYRNKHVVQAIEHLERIDDMERAGRFMKAAREDATQRHAFAMLIELAYRMNRPDWAVETAKAAAQKNIIMGAESFPILDMDIPTPPEIAFTHAVIRQESLFRTDIQSPAGAQGLMQLMPGTARDVARRLNIPMRDRTNPDFNLKLGTAYLQEQIGKFNGSYIMALAAYNAGPGRVRSWINTFGDPRTKEIDPVDWMELIPIYETRNYVQRIMENLQIYRARFNKGSAPLQIMEDINR